MNILSRIFSRKKEAPVLALPEPPSGAANYSFCETLAAYTWHIRPLTSKGKKYSGGADTLALCGSKASWDLMGIITLKSLQSSSVCAGCRRNFVALQIKGMKE